MSLATLCLTLIPLILPQDPSDGPGPGSLERRARIMGTVARVEVRAADRAMALQVSEAAFAALRATEQRLSTWIADSELSRANRQAVDERFTLTPQTAAELARAAAWVERSGGAFDPAVRGLIDAWDLRGEGRVPDAEELALARSICGWQHYRLSGTTLVRSECCAALDAGAFGKGAGLEAVLATLGGSDDTGVEAFVCELGGQLAWLVPPADELAIADPDDRAAVVARLKVPDGTGSVATSGNSERGIELADGRRVGHILDPRSGEPAADFGSVTVWARRALDADCLSTALFVLGPAEGLKLAESLVDCEAVFAVSGPAGSPLRLLATSGLRGRLHGESPTTGIEFFPTPSKEK